MSASADVSDAGLGETLDEFAEAFSSDEPVAIALNEGDGDADFGEDGSEVEGFEHVEARAEGAYGGHGVLLGVVSPDSRGVAGELGPVEDGEGGVAEGEVGDASAEPASSDVEGDALGESEGPAGEAALEDGAGEALGLVAEELEGDGGAEGDAEGEGAFEAEGDEEAADVGDDVVVFDGVEIGAVVGVFAGVVENDGAEFAAQDSEEGGVSAVGRGESGQEDEGGSVSEGSVADAVGGSRPDAGLGLVVVAGDGVEEFGFGHRRVFRCRVWVVARGFGFRGRVVRSPLAIARGRSRLDSAGGRSAGRGRGRFRAVGRILSRGTRA